MIASSTLLRVGCRRASARVRCRSPVLTPAAAPAELYRCSYDVACIRDRAPFRVLDPTFNAILSRAAAVMAQLAPVAGRAQDVAPFRTLSERTARAMEARLWSEEAGMFLAYDERAQAHAPRQAVSGVAAVFADLNATVTARLAATIDRADFCGPLARPRCYGLPSLSLSDANFSTHNYWCGCACRRARASSAAHTCFLCRRRLLRGTGKDPCG